MRRPALRSSLAPFGTSIFGEMTRLANQHGAINLAQGFPDFDGPEFLRKAAAEYVVSGPNQYARSIGMPELNRSISQYLQRFYEIEVDPDRQVQVFCGATEGLMASILGLVEPGDEVILFEPFFDSYLAAVALAGGTARFCPLLAPDYRIDRETLEPLFNARTRLLLLNSPHNPTGRVFSREELQLVADLCCRHDVRVLTDEVYEHLTFDGVEHTPLYRFPGMAERTFSLSSSGKTFSLTGWKIGWGFGAADMAAAAHAAHQFMTFSTATPLQLAMARGLQAPNDFFEGLKAEYQQRRDFLAGVLKEVGFTFVSPEGTYFILADTSRFAPPDDISFARYLTTEIGVACIPPSFFYQTAPEEGRRLARFAFCKRMETLEKAAERLQKLRPGSAA